MINGICYRWLAGWLAWRHGRKKNVSHLLRTLTTLTARRGVRFAERHVDVSSSSVRRPGEKCLHQVERRAVVNVIGDGEPS